MRHYESKDRHICAEISSYKRNQKFNNEEVYLPVYFFNVLNKMQTVVITIHIVQKTH